MRREASLRINDSRAGDGLLTATLTATGSADRKVSFRRTNSSMSTALGGDSFVLATLLHFMAIDHDVRVEAPVSGRLLRGVEELQAYWSLWKPDRYRRISIVPDEVAPGYPMDSGQGIAAFSGGVDSTYTVLRHARGMARSDRVDLGAVMVVHGFDIHHARRDVYDAALERIDAQLSDLEVERLSVWTDFRELGQDWEDSHGLGVAACLTLFQDRFTVGLIGGTFPYNYSKVMPWGSSPQTDHLFSTGSMDIRHDGAAASRMEKISTVAKWPTQARHLRVCYDGLTASSNCGRCYKCVTTYLNFRALGENPPDFDHVPTASDIRSLEAPSMRHLRTLRGISAHAHIMSNTGEWLDALDQAIVKSAIRLGARHGKYRARRLAARIRPIVRSQS